MGGSMAVEKGFSAESLWYWSIVEARDLKLSDHQANPEMNVKNYKLKYKLQKILRMNDELELKWQETFWKQLFVKGVDDQLKNNCAKVEAKE